MLKSIIPRQALLFFLILFFGVSSAVSAPAALAQWNPSEANPDRQPTAEEQATWDASARAQGAYTARMQQVIDLNEANEDPTNLSLFNTGDTFQQTVLSSFLCSSMGVHMGCEYNYKGEPIAGNTQASLFGAGTSMVAATFNSTPASSQHYIADLLKNMNITGAQPVYAQGLGFSALDPVLETWKVFRNLAYLFFVVIFVVIGFMIMFRQKVGQSAVTAQQAIPRIIVALILVTFSYAIAGFLIDLMYLFMFLLVGIFGQDADLIDQNFLQLAYFLITSGWDSVGAIGDFVSGTLDSLGQVIGEVSGALASVLFAIIISVAILIGTFRLFFELLKTYVTIVLTITFAPVLLMLGAIPGRDVFKGWIQSLVGNLAAFPAVLMVMIVYSTILENASGTEGGFLPPYLFGSGTSGFLPVLFGLGIILAMPEIVQKVKESLGAKDSFGWLVSAAQSSVKSGFPLGGRIAGLGVGAAVGGQAAARGFITAKGDMRNRLIAAQSRGGEGFGKGASAGVGAANWVSRSIGANQPDILNLLTKPIDDRYDKQGQKREQFLQALEDASQRIGTGGVGRPEESKDDK